MTPQQIELVQTTFAEVKPIAAAAADLFYSRLFALDPNLRTLFRGDMTAQGQMLMSMIGTAVSGLNNLESLVPVVRKLGARHVGYGVLDEHYPVVGSALLWTLEQGLGAKFTPEAREAWAAAYGVLAETMKQGALEARRGAP